MCVCALFFAHSAYVDQTPYFTVDKARRELGLEFIPLEVSVIFVGSFQYNLASQYV
jgi:hypothetical protein